mmetsp:Transcript_16924/g.40898  ORF Transcript_16924/g.40898 Transcript_16924/m.40898 type:complete len:280 (-) Transcript_16924:620-1459(-)
MEAGSNRRGASRPRALATGVEPRGDLVSGVAQHNLVLNARPLRWHLPADVQREFGSAQRAVRQNVNGRRPQLRRHKHDLGQRAVRHRDRVLSRGERIRELERSTALVALGHGLVGPSADQPGRVVRRAPSPALEQHEVLRVLVRHAWEVPARLQRPARGPDPGVRRVKTHNLQRGIGDQDGACVIGCLDARVHSLARSVLCLGATLHRSRELRDEVVGVRCGGDRGARAVRRDREAREHGARADLARVPRLPELRLGDVLDQRGLVCPWVLGLVERNLQ